MYNFTGFVVKLTTHDQAVNLLRLNVIHLSKSNYICKIATHLVRRVANVLTFNSNYVWHLPYFKPRDPDNGCK